MCPDDGGCEPPPCASTDPGCDEPLACARTTTPATRSRSRVPRCTPAATTPSTEEPAAGTSRSTSPTASKRKLGRPPRRAGVPILRGRWPEPGRTSSSPAMTRRRPTPASEASREARLLPAPAREHVEVAAGARRRAPGDRLPVARRRGLERLEETLIYADVGAPDDRQDRRAARDRGRRGELAGGEDAHAPAPGAARRAAARTGDTIDLTDAADRDPHDRRQRHRQDDHDRQDGLAPVAGARPARCCSPRATPSAPPPSSSSTLWGERAGCEIVRGRAGLGPGRGRLRRHRGRRRRAATTS